MLKKICFIFIIFNLYLYSNSEPVVKKPQLYTRGGIFKIKGTKTPFTGMVTDEKDREFYKNGKPHGKWLTFYENGNLKSIENWENGILNGKHILYGNEETKLSETYYEQGDEDGKYILFHDNGKPYIVGEFKNGLASGVWHYYNENGKLTGKNDFRKKSKKRQN